MNQHNSSGIIKIVSLLVCIGGLSWFGWSAIAKYQQTQQLRQANRLLAQQKYADAITAYDRLLGTNFGRPYLVWVNRGTAFGGLNRYQQMLQSCSNATLIRPEAAIGWNCQGEALYFLEQYSNALDAFDNATRLDPQEAVFWLNKARVLSDVRRYPDAIDATRRAIESIKQARGNNRKQLAIAFEQQGQTLLKTNQNRLALEAFEQSLDNAPNYLPPQLGKGVALYRLGNYQQAIATFEQTLQRDDLTPEQEAVSWLYTGVSLCQTQQSNAAKSAFERVLQLPADSQSRTIARKGCGI